MVLIAALHYRSVLYSVSRKLVNEATISVRDCSRLSTPVLFVLFMVELSKGAREAKLSFFPPVSEH